LGLGVEGVELLASSDALSNSALPFGAAFGFGVAFGFGAAFGLALAFGLLASDSSSDSCFLLAGAFLGLATFLLLAPGLVEKKSSSLPVFFAGAYEKEGANKLIVL
jgi:high-affinity Fe2+/Pb2+ permease